jgi:hypothetical protein
MPDAEQTANASGRRTEGQSFICGTCVPMEAVREHVFEVTLAMSVTLGKVDTAVKIAHKSLSVGATLCPPRAGPRPR